MNHCQWLTAIVQQPNRVVSSWLTHKVAQHFYRLLNTNTYSHCTFMYTQTSYCGKLWREKVLAKSKLNCIWRIKLWGELIANRRSFPQCCIARIQAKCILWASIRLTHASTFDGFAQLWLIYVMVHPQVICIHTGLYR